MSFRFRDTDVGRESERTGLRAFRERFSCHGITISTVLRFRDKPPQLRIATDSVETLQFQCSCQMHDCHAMVQTSFQAFRDKNPDTEYENHRFPDSVTEILITESRIIPIPAFRGTPLATEQSEAGFRAP